jgi:hypothetical protein
MLVQQTFKGNLGLVHSLHKEKRLVSHEILVSQHHKSTRPLQGKSLVSFLSRNELFSHQERTAQRVVLVLVIWEVSVYKNFSYCGPNHRIIEDKSPRWVVN